MNEPKQIVAELIPLYKMTIRFKVDPNDSYEMILISDSLDGLIRGIVDVELEFGEFGEDTRKYFTISDFVLVPCERANGGYYLYDVDEHNCAEGRTSFYEQYYHVFFKGDRPVPVQPSTEIEERISFFETSHTVVYTAHSEFKSCMANTLHDMAQKSPYHDLKNQDQAAREKLCTEKTLEAVLSIIDREKKGES